MLGNRTGPLSRQTTIPDLAPGGVNTSRISINTIIDALAEEGRVTILAQPNLTAISGQTASFLAGSEFPILRALAGRACAAMPGSSSNEERRAMTRSGRRFAPAPCVLRGMTAGGALALMLAGCVETTTAPWGLNLGDYQAPARDLIGVGSYSAEHVIRLGPGGAISQAERADLGAFLTEIAYNRPESVRIVVNGRATTAQRSALVAALTTKGVSPEHVVWARDSGWPGQSPDQVRGRP